MSSLIKSSCLVTIILSSVHLVLSGCGDVSEEAGQEIQSRRDSAFDVSGNYVEEIRQGYPANLELSNEVGFYDINGSLTIKRQLDLDERLEVANGLYEILPGVVEAQVYNAIKALELSLTKVSLGEGNSMASRGGESVSLEPSRRTTEIVLHSPVESFKTVIVGRKRYHLRRNLKVYLSSQRDQDSLGYSLTGHTDNESRALDGQKGIYLELTATEGREAKVVGPIRLNINSMTKY